MKTQSKFDPKRYAKQYYRTNRKQILARLRRLRKDHRQEVRNYNKQWRLAHPEQTRQHAIRSAKKHKVRIQAYKKKWAKRNVLRCRTKAKQWYQANRKRILERRVERVFKLPTGLYSTLVKMQVGRCLICGQRPTRSLAVDHDHSTGAIRGLLCGPCNTGMGHLKDNPMLLEKAAQYLRERMTTDLRAIAQQPENVVPLT